MLEALALVDLNKRSDLRYELLQAASYILHNIEKWESQNDKSEAEVVGQVNEMLKIVFNSSKLKIRIGEIGAACTRENRKSRETSFSGGSSSAFITGNSSNISKKNINARKIDLMITGANDVELSICEFKAKDEYRSLTKQSGKCARLNQALLEDLKTIEVNEMVVGMNWGDRSGELFGVQEADGVFICYQLSRLTIPAYRVLIGDVFISLMKDLYAWKDHLEALNDKVIVNSARVGPIKRKRDSYVCCLTPKWAPNKK